MTDDVTPPKIGIVMNSNASSIRSLSALTGVEAPRCIWLANEVVREAQKRDT